MISERLKNSYCQMINDFACPEGKNVQTHLTIQEKYQLRKIAISLPPKTIAVEIGSYLGASSIYIANGLKKVSESALYCIDTWQNDAMSEGNRDTYSLFKKNTQRYESIITPLRGSSEEVGKGFDRAIDFLFVDGDHSYEGVKLDVDSWFDKVKPGGIVAFHDIGWSEGVQQVVKENVKPKLQAWQSLPNLFWGKLK